METIDTTNGRLARVLADLDELINWARADAEHSAESGADAQSADDSARVRVLETARQYVRMAQRY